MDLIDDPSRVKYDYLYSLSMLKSLTIIGLLLPIYKYVCTLSYEEIHFLLIYISIYISYP